MTPLIAKFTKDEKTFNQIKSTAPKLAKLFQNHTMQKSKNIDKNINRDH
jgi:hypothetical protein